MEIRKCAPEVHSQEFKIKPVRVAVCFPPAKPCRAGAGKEWELDLPLRCVGQDCRVTPERQERVGSGETTPTRD